MRGHSYRVTLTADLADTAGRSLTQARELALVIPAEGAVTAAAPPDLAVTYDSVTAAASDLGGRFPGGQTMLFQGLWTDPATGLAYARNRWYDPHNAAWMSEDPALDIDSTNLYAFVGWGPQMYTDPYGDLTWREAWAFTKGAAKTAAIGLGAVAVGAGVVAVGVVSAPVAVVAGAGIGAYALISRTAERYEQATDVNPHASLGESAAVALGDVSGVSGAVEAAAGTEVYTGRELSSEERYGRAGGATGAVVTMFAAPAVARGVHGTLSFDDFGVAAQQGLTNAGREMSQSASAEASPKPAALPQAPGEGVGPNRLVGRDVSTPTKGEGGVYQFEVDGKIKTGSTVDYNRRYSGGKITKEYPQTRFSKPEGVEDSAYRWTPRRQRRFDEELLDRTVPADQRYRAPGNPKAPVSQDKWQRFRHIFGYGDEPK